MRLQIGVTLVGCAMACAAPSAHAFTMQGNETDQYNLQKFDLDEQMRNFRTGSPDASPNTGKPFEVPFGNGTLQFGVRQGTTDVFGSSFGSPFGPLGPPPRNTREDFNRVVTPENLR